MKNINKEIISGIAIFISFIIFIFGFLYLKNITFKANSYRVYMHFQDITGLEPGDKISFSGLQIGKVKHFGLQGLNVIVTAELNPDFKLPRDSRAYIKSLGMVGEKFIDIIPGNATEYLHNGDRIEGTIEGDLSELAYSAKDMMKQVQELLAQIQSVLTNVFDETAQSDLKESIQHLREISNTVNQNTNHLENTLVNIESMSKNLNEMLLEKRDQMESSIQNFHDVSTRFDDLASRADKSLASTQAILAKLENQEGTVGKVLSDDQLYDDVRSLTTELQTLLQDFKQRPQKYVNFGFIKIF